MARTQTGAAISAFEYRRFQTGTPPLWTPLRFPGQSHDAETDLFENWNRYYDPSVGRYLPPEPLLQDPTFVKTQALQGLGAPAYAYALNNPNGFVDPDGNAAVAVPVIVGVGTYCSLNPHACQRIAQAGAIAAAAALGAAVAICRNAMTTVTRSTPQVCRYRFTIPALPGWENFVPAECVYICPDGSNKFAPVPPSGNCLPTMEF